MLAQFKKKLDERYIIGMRFLDVKTLMGKWMLLRQMWWINRLSSIETCRICKNWFGAIQPTAVASDLTALFYCNDKITTFNLFFESVGLQGNFMMGMLVLSWDVMCFLPVSLFWGLLKKIGLQPNQDGIMEESQKWWSEVIDFKDERNDRASCERWEARGKLEEW